MSEKRDLVATAGSSPALGYGALPGGGDDADDRNEEGKPLLPSPVFRRRCLATSCRAWWTGTRAQA